MLALEGIAVRYAPDMGRRRDFMRARSLVLKASMSLSACASTIAAASFCWSGSWVGWSVLSLYFRSTRSLKSVTACFHLRASQAYSGSRVCASWKFPAWDARAAADQ